MAGYAGGADQERRVHQSWLGVVVSALTFVGVRLISCSGAGI